MTYDPEWTLDVLARIRVYHGAQDTGAAAEVAWTEALAAAGIRSGADAVAAVVRHYSQPNCNPWITPGDVIAGVRAIRRDRLAQSDLILPDVDPDDVQAWLAARRAGVTALADGRADPPRAIEGAQDGRVRAALPGVFRRPDRPRPSDYTAKAIEAPKPTVSPADAAALEAERDRQLAELERLTAPAPAAAP